jgi:hypothetical protein
MKAQEGLMRRDCAQSGLNVPPWEQRIWEAGNKDKALIGHAMRPLAAQQGKTPYDRWLRFLDQNQQWLAYLDTFATQLSTSSTLSMLLSNGYVGADGTLINRECLQINKQALVDHFHLKDKEDVSYQLSAAVQLLSDDLGREGVHVLPAASMAGSHPCLAAPICRITT